MSLTSNFDYCVEMGIAQVRQIFHLAFKNEERYPHNFGPFTRNFSGREVIVSGSVHDDETDPADLFFADPKHIRFSFPFDIFVETPDAPDPALSRLTLTCRVDVLARLDDWPEDGKDVLGLTFDDITPAAVTITNLSGLPTFGVSNFQAAVHSKYDTVPHVYTDAASGGRLVLYDGNRDIMLDPPNLATPFEIQVALETHSAQEYLKVTAPIHVRIPIPGGGGNYESYGRIIFWRRVVRTSTTITVEMNGEPADAALKTQIELDNTAAIQSTELTGILNQVHAAYDAVNHVHTLGGNELIVYDDNRDPDLDPENLATPYNIEAVFETHAAIEYLKFTIPIHVDVPTAFYTSYGRVIFWRQVTRTATTLSVNMGSTPADPALATVVELDAPSVAKPLIISSLTPLVNSTLGGFGSPSGPSFGQVTTQLQAMAVSAINGFGDITEPAFDEPAARQLLAEEIANYLVTRRFPVYSPDSGDETEPLSTPAGFCLVADDVLAILMNRRTGTEADDVAPDNFLGSHEVALAVGAAKVREFIDAAVTDPEDGVFPELHKDNGAYVGEQPIHTDEGDATLKRLTIDLADPGTHDESEGHLWVTGEAEVHIDCWPDPDVSFDGPIFIDATEGVDENGECTLTLQARAGEFDVGQSCCDVLIDLLIPVVGIIMLIIIENMIDQVGGELAGEIAAGQARHIQAIPPVVNGIAEVKACLKDLNITSQGFVLPGDMHIRRLGRSFEDLEEGGDLPRP